MDPVMLLQSMGLVTGPPTSQLLFSDQRVVTLRSPQKFFDMAAKPRFLDLS
ncbi:uncharacterized protein TrAtP1_004874 [Trichoderma atroviride]|uniref:Uncharacterized protein n=1 Tax=Hypocrea atroviridis (strain ATCC 20476 / IMI 206040) TaxID=452589 RepID=G9P672_HYPAI|nr:uncharacterized protein TRIATDRAFT_311969 [Trichoderma atroviride IMI 206040]EHK41404.1 hypothetical protein TRIATDRAFT_311969 [Trichoderma atroviride IMI 206040]UKZ63648.1 hypothetical protein TrAtP1_004874 [Trichoderma atroviride]